MRKHELGATYLSYYWKEKYTVLAVNEETGTVAVKWLSDGRVTAHGTPLDKKDVMINSGGDEK